jgi:hypothetical protein
MPKCFITFLQNEALIPPEERIACGDLRHAYFGWVLDSRSKALKRGIIVPRESPINSL